MKDLFSLEAPGCDVARLQAMVEEGNIQAYNALACCYLDKRNSTEEDKKKAIELLKQAAKKGNDNAMGTLWSFFIMKRDKKNAEKWAIKMHALHVKKQSKKPTMQGEFDLAFDQQYGFGVEQDIQEAKKKFESLAKRGFNQAYYALGLMFESGSGYRKNRSAAIRRYKKGAELFEPNCMMALANYYMESGDHYNPIEAYRLYSIVSRYKYGWAEAQYKMADYYIYGMYGNEKEDLEMAKQYLIAADSLGNLDAAILLNAIQYAEKECIRICGSLAATPKNQLHMRIAAAIHIIQETGQLIPLD